jgi:hypothetical protein
MAYWGSQQHAGACGEKHPDSYPLIGVSVKLPFTDSMCGKYVQILNGANNKTVILPVGCRSSLQNTCVDHPLTGQGLLQRLRKRRRLSVARRFVIGLRRVFVVIG